MADNETSINYTLKEMVEIIFKKVHGIEAKVDLQNGRVRKNEIKISYIYGALGVLGLAIALVRAL